MGVGGASSNVHNILSFSFGSFIACDILSVDDDEDSDIFEQGTPKVTLCVGTVEVPDKKCFDISYQQT